VLAGVVLKGIGVKTIVKGVAKESAKNVIMGTEVKNAPPTLTPVTATPTITYPDTPNTTPANTPSKK